MEAYSLKCWLQWLRYLVTCKTWLGLNSGTLDQLPTTAPLRALDSCFIIFFFLCLLLYLDQPVLFLFIGSGTSLTYTTGVIIVNNISHMILSLWKRRSSLQWRFWVGIPCWRRNPNSRPFDSKSFVDQHPNLISFWFNSWLDPKKTYFLFSGGD